MGWGRPAPWPCPSFCVGAGKAQVLERHPPEKSRNQGSKISPTKVGIPLVPAQEGNPDPQTSSQRLAKQEASLPTPPPKRGSKTKKGNNLLTQRCPGEGGADKWDPPPQTGLAQGEFPNPPEQTPTQSGEGQCLEAEKSWDQAGFPPGVEFLCCAAPTSLLRQQSPGWERDRGLHSSALHLLLWILTCWSHRSSGKLVGQRVPPGPRKLEGRTSAQGGASTPAPAGSCWVLGGGSLPCN